MKNSKIDNYKKENKWTDHTRKVDKISWDEYFILLAYLASTRSLDAQTQCGALIVDPTNKTVLSTGYNSFIAGIDDSALPNMRPHKYPFMIHAEQNAILSCAKNGHSCNGATVYATGKPCSSCLQNMHQAGIKQIRYYKYHSMNMVENEEQKILFNIICGLSQIELIPLTFDDTFSDKIDNIKNCRISEDI